MTNVPSSHKILATVFLTILIDMLGMGILIPVFPMLIAPHSSFNIIPNNWTMSQGFIMAGWLMACFPLVQFFSAPLLGQLADKYGRRKVLAFSISGTAISYALFAVAVSSKNIPLMFISRALDGASGGNISVAQAIIGDISEPANRAKNFGLVGVALGVGFVLGPFLGGILSNPGIVGWFDVATPFWFATGLSILNVSLILKLLPETLKLQSERRLVLSKPIQNITKAFLIAEIGNIIPAIFLFNAGFTFFTTFWGVVLADKFNFSQGQIGNFYAYIGIMVVLAQGGVVRRLSGKVAEYKVLRYSLIGTGICLTGYAFIPVTHVTWIYFLPPIMAVCIALTKAFSNALLTHVSPVEIRGEIMGINSSALALAQAISALLAGYIAAQHTLLPILVGGITVICGGILFRYSFKVA
jgi:DHA1 family tetracycline resistance protein-like MFS transporter